MTAIHRSGRCDKRDLKDFKVAVDVAWSYRAISSDANTVGGMRATSENYSAEKAKATNAPQCRQARAVRHCSLHLSHGTAFRSEFVGRPLATPKKRSPINDEEEETEDPDHDNATIVECAGPVELLHEFSLHSLKHRRQVESDAYHHRLRSLRACAIHSWRE